MFSQMLTHKYRSLARFGLMHMVATNLCVWLENVVKETVRQLDTVANTTDSYTVQGNAIHRFL